MTAFLDLFSGIGGFALAAHWAGLRFDKHFFSEVDNYAVELYQKRFPDAIPLGDIKNVDYSKLPTGEYLVAGGFPCQPHSDAGLKKGAEDERDLWPECRRMLCQLRPKIALFENVRGLLTSPGGKQRGEFFNGVLSDIRQCGYDAEWQTISAADVGAPQPRKRVWIVAYFTNGWLQIRRKFINAEKEMQQLSGVYRDGAKCESKPKRKVLAHDNSERCEELINKIPMRPWDTNSADSRDRSKIG